MKITLVYNSRSGGRYTLSQLHSLFEKYGIEVTSSVAIQPNCEARLRTAIAMGEYIAVVGGDGTISFIAGLIAGTDAVLIPLPGGTLNHFTKDLGVDQHLETAISNITTARARLIDIGSVNNISFINNSSIGLYPSSLHTRRRLEDRLGKWPAALIGCIRAVLQYHTYDIVVNGKHVKTPFLFVGNNDYKLDAYGPEGRTLIDEGILSVYVLNSQTRWALIKLFIHALVGKLSTLDDFIAFTATTLEIKTRRHHISVSHDGEVSRITTPIIYSIKKKHLTVL